MSTQLEIDQHYTVFQDLVAQSERYLAAGNVQAAAVYAEIAASYATENHTGLFVSYRLEKVLLTIGKKVANRTYGAKKEPIAHPARRRVTHVLTEAAGIGGHTRMVWNWIQEDTDSQHSVVLTRQGYINVPAQLQDGIKASGGKLFRLNHNAGDLITWARQLRKIASDADLIVLHIYTDDVIPLIAFADKQSLPPVILLNHSDHKFWLGASISDVVADQRRSGAILSQARRGIDADRSALLPVVVAPISRQLSISEAKKEIGLSPDSILLLSIARPSKYKPFLSGYGARMNDLVFPDVILPVLKQHTNAVLYVIGPNFDGCWKTASQSVQGRIKALGRREDTAVFYQAADIYIDSFPFTSITSCLEAGRYGLPVISIHPYSSASDVLCADTQALDECILRVGDGESLLDTLSHLIDDTEYRASTGEFTRKTILAVHTSENWRRYLHELYDQAAAAPHLTAPNLEDEPKAISELDLLSVDLDRGKDSVETITRDHMRLLPFPLRLGQWLSTIKENRLFLPSLLLPEWLAIRIIKARFAFQARVQSSQK